MPVRLPAAQYSVPMADEPERIADALEGINDRPAAVERMGREQFELDQRLTALDDAVAEVLRRMTAVQETTSAVRAEHATRLVDLQRVVEQSRLTPRAPTGSRPWPTLSPDWNAGSTPSPRCSRPSSPTTPAGAPPNA